MHVYALDSTWRIAPRTCTYTHTHKHIRICAVSEIDSRKWWRIEYIFPTYFRRLRFMSDGALDSDDAFAESKLALLKALFVLQKYLSERASFLKLREAAKIPQKAARHARIRSIRKLRIHKLRIVDSKFPEAFRWTWELHPFRLRVCLCQTLRSLASQYVG